VKTPPAGIAAQYASGTPTLAAALKIARTDNQVFGFTSADADALIGGVLYKASPGLDLTNVQTSAGLAVDNLELTTLDDGTLFTKADVLDGIWRNAAFTLFRYNWANLADGIDTLLTGTLGDGDLRRSTIVFELRGLQQYLQQPVGDVSSPTCRARLGDARCTKDLTAFRFTGTVTAAGQQTFTASAMAQATDYFTDGQIDWLTGANAGRSRRVKTHVSGGVFTLALPMLLTVAVGDTFRATAGCTKRPVEDCGAKFSNILNFQGEPHRPTLNDLTKPAEPSV
jgi:uncharacterized phage protein (TIGR02218 family)